MRTDRCLNTTYCLEMCSGACLVGRYRTIVADPPWPVKSPGVRTETGYVNPTRGLWRGQGGVPYLTMPIAQIATLPVNDLADPDGCHLYLWTVNAHVRDAYDLASTWGFYSSTLLTWCKEPRGIGLGGAFTIATEHVLFCRRGTLKALRRHDRNWWRWTRTRHSAKPQAFLDIVETVSPGPRLELFARTQRLGWDTWGNEALNHVEMTP
jgi:N6-adenosine-specific RNA methylase IME4